MSNEQNQVCIKIHGNHYNFFTRLPMGLQKGIQARDDEDEREDRKSQRKYREKQTSTDQQ